MNNNKSLFQKSMLVIFCFRYQCLFTLDAHAMFGYRCSHYIRLCLAEQSYSLICNALFQQRSDLHFIFCRTISAYARVTTLHNVSLPLTRPYSRALPRFQKRSARFDCFRQTLLHTRIIPGIPARLRRTPTSHAHVLLCLIRTFTVRP